MNQAFMKEKPIFRLIISMSLPMVISMAVNALYNIVDSYFVAKISGNAMTALSLVYPVQNLVTAITVGFAVGINAVIAFHLGAENQNKANSAATHGIIFNTLHGVLLTAFCLGIMPFFLKMFTDDSDVINLGLNYSNIVFSFSIVVALGISFEKIFQSVGKMLVSMISMAAGCISNIILDPLLIFGIGPFPQLGIKGAAIATVAGQFITLILYLIFYFAKPINVKIDFRNFKWNEKMIKKLYLIGIPAALNMALPSALISLLNAILAAFSQIYILVLGIYYKLQTFLYLSANGIIQGIRPLVSFNYGAGEHKRVKKIYLETMVLTVSIMIAGTILCLTIPDKLIGIFTDNSETIEVGVTALRTISIGFIASAVSVVSCGALEGLSMGIPSLIISLCRYIIIIVPAAFVMSRLIGADGVWNAFWITEILTAIISYLIYRKKTKYN